MFDLIPFDLVGLHIKLPPNYGFQNINLRLMKDFLTIFFINSKS